MADAPTAAQRALTVLGDNVKRQRGDRSQSDLGDRCKIKQSVVSRIETGSYPALTVSLILRLAVALDCSPSDLTRGLDEIAVIARYETDRTAA